MITVLRLGHRPERDKRITTHVCLTARALGAERVVLNTRDERVEESVNDITRRFGGPFAIETGVAYRPLLRDFQGTKVHLTMYGMPMQDVVPKIDMTKDLLIVVGAEKVPRDVYDLVDHNIAVGNQPHSEVAALSLLMYALQGDAVFERRFEQGELRVEPSERGKIVRSNATGAKAPEPPFDP